MPIFRGGCLSETWSFENSPCCITAEYCNPIDDNVSTTWFFGDGTVISSTDPVTYCYCNEGTYNVSGSNSYGSSLTLGSFPAVITGTCFTPDFSATLQSYQGCSDPWDCSASSNPIPCHDVVVTFTDETESYFPETIISVRYEAHIYNAGVYQYSLVEYGSGQNHSANITFNDWHGGIRIIVDQHVTSCLG